MLMAAHLRCCCSTRTWTLHTTTTTAACFLQDLRAQQAASAQLQVELKAERAAKQVGLVARVRVQLEGGRGSAGGAQHPRGGSLGAPSA